MLNLVIERAKELRAAQRVYMADRGNEKKGRNVAAAAAVLDAAIEKYERANAGAASSEVIAAIDGERAYQAERWGADHDADESVGNFLLYIERYLQRAKDAYIDANYSTPALHEVRKIAALAVACMERHGAPRR